MNSKAKNIFSIYFLIFDKSRFAINPHLSKNVTLEKCLTFSDSEGKVKTYKLTEPDLNYFLFDTTFEIDSFLDEALKKDYLGSQVMT